MSTHPPGIDSGARDAWTEAGAFAVAPGVHRIPLPLPQDGLRAVNVYAIETGQGVALVDAGWAIDESRERLERSLTEVGFGLGDITRFLITHIHRDHYTQAVTIRREFGTDIALGIDELPAFAVMEDPTRPPFAPQLAQLEEAGAEPVVRRLMAGRRGRRPKSVIWERPDRWLEDRTTIRLHDRELLTVATPGHTQGHVVFVDETNGVLFAGDHVLPHITPSIGFEAATGSLPLRSYLESLALVRSMPDMLLLPAHGPVTDSAHRRIDELIAHHDDRLAACRSAVQAGAGTGYETARALPWTRRARRLDDLDPFNQMLAVTETIAHLDLLVARGTLASETDDGTKTYAVP